ncbi:molybdenum cofactor sulfurylase [Polaribacter sp. KT25b]|uniref:xanthine dehydrogenase accessory protein XdhC n=1 Tax=Polaribacter sp. KT25b TaxID=1855336 RepID=UPI00087BA49F|nr:xanthine dehydrogenase accessory protein XdhC [Polaribacter sp. KT25b]SDS56835.1 molybdenum cofactor sulfurylase [Polaribacter sp. KT25b]
MFHWIEILNRFQQEKKPVALVTITKCLGSAPCKVGSRMIVDKTKVVYGTIGGGKLEFEVIDKAINAIKENKIIEASFTLGPEFEQCCGGKVELIIEPMNQSPELFLFGAGHIGVEISNLLVDTPFKTYLIDSRTDWFENLKLHESVKTCKVSENDFKTFKDVVTWGKNTYVLVMTHDHGIDLDIIAMAIPEEKKYLGLIGSKTKYVRFNNILKKELQIEEGMENVTCPIGLNLGGSTPKEIAIDCVAQLLQIHYNQNNNK